MKLEQFGDVLDRTLDDRRISRSERRAVSRLLADEHVGPHDLQTFRSAAFERARNALRDSRDADVLDWLRDMMGLLMPPAPEEVRAEAHFSPGPDCRERIASLIRDARRSIDVCVYTITDDRIAEALLAAHGRGVQLRVLSDISKSSDLGSDIGRLSTAGVPVAVDTADKFMHHKYAVFDGKIVVTGSYNWTRSAYEFNEENIVVSDNPRLVERFAAEFERLWVKYV